MDTKKDTVFFKEANYKKLSAIRTFVSKRTDDRYLTVKVFDVNGQNITERISIGQYVKGKGTYNLDLDSSKTVRLDFKRDSSRIVITSLRRLFGQDLEIQINDSNYYEITLNVANDWIFHANSDWGGRGDFRLLKTNQGLQTLEADFVYGAEIYLRQKN